MSREEMSHRRANHHVEYTDGRRRSVLQKSREQRARVGFPDPELVVSVTDTVSDRFARFQPIEILMYCADLRGIPRIF